MPFHSQSQLPETGPDQFPFHRTLNSAGRHKREFLSLPESKKQLCQLVVSDNNKDIIILHGLKYFPLTVIKTI